MDARNFRAPFLPPDQIWKRADEVREKYPAGRSFPVEVLDLAEFDLGLELVPADGLRRLCDTEAVLLGDLKTILVDKDAFTNPKQEYRLRFSVAHEIGHLILHPDVYGQVRPVSVEGWSEFFLNLPDEQYQWLELHANEFAGRLLVPPDRLKAAFDAAIQRAQASGLRDWDRDADKAEVVLSYVASAISKPFKVSADVIKRRLRKEKLWPPA
jgi:hypothetical protein